MRKCVKKAGAAFIVMTFLLGIMPVTNVHAANEAEDLRPKYDVTVQTAGEGRASASVISAKEGEKIQLTAVPDSGSEFTGWQVVGADVTVQKVDDHYEFKMPAANITVKAVFRLLEGEKEASADQTVAVANTTDSPKTGDTTNMAWPVGLLALSGVAAGIIVYKSKKEARQN